jgi:hypothetical protein
MDEHVGDALPALLAGEAAQWVVLTASAHLRGCLDCRYELINAMTAHAGLRSACRIAPTLMRTDPLC